MPARLSTVGAKSTKLTSRSIVLPGWPGASSAAGARERCGEGPGWPGAGASGGMVGVGASVRVRAAPERARPLGRGRPGPPGEPASVAS